jgi:hypothetical protein
MTSLKVFQREGTMVKRTKNETASLHGCDDDEDDGG